MAFAVHVTKEMLQTCRRQLLPAGSIATYGDCLAAVNKLGLVWPFTPGTDLLPSLFPALATDQEGQRWDWMWGWKDRMPAAREAHYGKLVAGKPTLISLEWLPVCYALTGNTGDLEDDMAQLAGTVRLQDLAYKVIRYLEEHGPTGTRTLIAKLTDGSRPMKGALEKALLQLDTAMLIAKCGAEGGNSIAHTWTLFPRQFPEAVDRGTEIATRDAALQLLRHFFTLTPVITEKALPSVFPWSAEHQRKAIARLKEAGELESCSFEGKPSLCKSGFATA